VFVSVCVYYSKYQLKCQLSMVPIFEVIDTNFAKINGSVDPFWTSI